LLDPDHWRGLLRAARDQFDCVVIDTAPMISFGDALALAPHADATCLVLRAGRTPRAAAERACETLSLAHAKLAGVVLNGQAGGAAFNS
jgi:Mrp family chromosome partitioning ATPase